MSIVSNNLKKIKPSPTLAVTQKARELKAAGKNVIGLGAGEPDFDTPNHVIEAAMMAMNAGQTRYTNVAGTLALRQAVCDKYQRDNLLSDQMQHVLVSNGAKQSIYNLTVALLNVGYKVILLAP